MNQTSLPNGFQSTLCRSLLTALLCSAAVGCGDDEPGPTPIAGTSGGGSGAGGQSGGGAAGAPAPAAPVACGTAMCTPRPNPLTAFLGGMGQTAGIPTPVACCVDEANGVCGIAATAGATCEVYATPDTRCPGIDLGAAAGGLGAALGGLGQGCCTPTNQCGLDGAIFGRGCVDNGQARSMLSAIPLVGSFIMVPPALACDRPVEDGGVDDAGI